MPAASIFDIAEIGIPPYSHRGISETLEPLAGQMFRDINGTLHDAGADQFRKYKLTVTCTDMDSPALDGVWPGRAMTVDCVSELCYRDGTDAEAGRTAVPGSTRSADGFVFYRPRLSMRVVSYTKGTRDGWGGKGVAWQLVLEEA